MSIRAVIFDLGGVLIDIDWVEYGKNERLSIQKNGLYPYNYEQLNVELAQFIADLRPLYKIATICNGGSREAVNRKFKLGELVDLMVFDGEEKVSKPDRRIYRIALLRLEVQADEAIFIDDKKSNIEAAQQIGMHTVHFENTREAIANIQAILERQ